VRRDFLLANFELPDADVAVEFVLPTQRLDGEDEAELLEDVVGVHLPGLEAARLRPEVDEVLVDKKFRRRTVEDDDGGHVVVVHHRPKRHFGRNYTAVCKYIIVEPTF